MPSRWGIQQLTVVSCFKAPDCRLCFQKFMAHMWEGNNLVSGGTEVQQNVYNIQHTVALGREVYIDPVPYSLSTLSQILSDIFMHGHRVQRTEPNKHQKGR